MVGVWGVLPCVGVADRQVLDDIAREPLEEEDEEDDDDEEVEEDAAALFSDCSILKAFYFCSLFLKTKFADSKNSPKTPR